MVPCNRFLLRGFQRVLSLEGRGVVGGGNTPTTTNYSTTTNKMTTKMTNPLLPATCPTTTGPLLWGLGGGGTGLWKGPFQTKSALLHTSSLRRMSNENEAAAPSRPAKGQGQPAPSRVEKTVNQITLMGRVGADPQMRGSTEHPVVVFSMATHANYNYQSGEMLQKTDWHRICVFKPYLRDTVYKYMTKGQRVYITGRVSYGEIEDDQGKSHTTTSIIADDVIFITDSRNKSA